MGEGEGNALLSPSDLQWRSSTPKALMSGGSRLAERGRREVGSGLQRRQRPPTVPPSPSRAHQSKQPVEGRGSDACGGDSTRGDTA